MPVPETRCAGTSTKGGQVQIKVNSTGRTFTGTVVRFSRSLDTNTRTMLTEVDVPNADLSLSPGMYAGLTIQLEHKSDAITLPAQAVVQSSDQIYVLVVDATNHVEKRNVILGIETANQVEITNGLREGEQVIASGQTNYQAGEAVAPHAASHTDPTSQEVTE